MKILIAAMLVLVVLIATVAYAPVASERNSPRDRINHDQISVWRDSVNILMSDVSTAIVSDTNSMDPTLDEGSTLLLVKPQDKSDILEGDIITFYRDGRLIVHRVLQLGADEEGWYAVTRGDNNPADDGRIRWKDVDRVVAGILY
ncbi:MAG: signal peptidase I [Candidatus Aenigmarchaeota archaeon]|nr:signal peptidase I [Candidatus Aenigmarchaeota archaeon]